MSDRLISHYRILHKLGEGGMGVVYKAEDTRLNRLVALKLLPGDLTEDTEVKQRFVQEARAASALNHPNISIIYDIGESEEGMYIAMEWVEGGRLADNIESGILDIEAAANIAIQVGEALREAHRKGIIHRDIKSENILISKTGQVKIIDFGVAKLLGGTDPPELGLRIGTMAYMSPEQIWGKEVDHRTDIWSLGIVFYEMLAGERPFKGDYEESLIYSILNTDPVVISKLRPDVPETASRILHRALAKDVANRYQTVQPFIEDLKAMLRTASSTAGELISVAVLPFEDISSEKNNEYFSDGLTEELIMHLSQLHNMKVISRTTVMQYKGTKKNIKTIGEELGVRYILEGSVRKFEDDLLITAQLIGAEADAHLWAAKYKGNLEEVFSMQENVSKHIVEALQVNLTPTEERALVKRPTGNPEAFDYLLRARDALYRMTKNDVKSAIQLFLRAIELDDQYAAAHAGLGEAYARLYLYFERNDSYLNTAVDACLKAIMLDAELPEAYSALGMAYFNKNMLDEAMTTVKKAIELDPNNFIAYWILGRIYRTTDRDRDAIDLFKKVIALNPDFYAVHMDLRSVYERLGEMDDYAAAVKRELEVYPRYLSKFPEDPRAHIFYAVALARAKRVEEAKLEAVKALELNPTDPLMMYNSACFYAQLGDKTLAIESLRNALEAGMSDYEWIKRDPDLDCIRDEPDYTNLMKRK
jgi:serine/threonine protein kinase/regulator of sirC expression with transglutaminase-like and TPR domain